jgi:hypothetical protein
MFKDIYVISSQESDVEMCIFVPKTSNSVSCKDMHACAKSAIEAVKKGLKTDERS